MRLGVDGCWCIHYRSAGAFALLPQTSGYAAHRLPHCISSPCGCIFLGGSSLGPVRRTTKSDAMLESCELALADRGSFLCRYIILSNLRRGRSLPHGVPMYRDHGFRLCILAFPSRYPIFNASRHEQRPSEQTPSLYELPAEQSTGHALVEY